MAFKMRGFSGFKQAEEKKNVKVVPGSTYGDDDAMHFKGIDAKGDTATYETFGYDAEIDAATDSVGVQGPRVDAQALEDSMLSPAEREAEKVERERMAKAKAEREKKSPTKQVGKEAPKQVVQKAPENMLLGGGMRMEYAPQETQVTPKVVKKNMPSMIRKEAPKSILRTKKSPSFLQKEAKQDYNTGKKRTENKMHRISKKRGKAYTKAHEARLAGDKKKEAKHTKKAEKHDDKGVKVQNKATGENNSFIYSSEK